MYRPTCSFPVSFSLILRAPSFSLSKTSTPRSYSHLLHQACRLSVSCDTSQTNPHDDSETPSTPSLRIAQSPAQPCPPACLTFAPASPRAPCCTTNPRQLERHQQPTKEGKKVQGNKKQKQTIQSRQVDFSEQKTPHASSPGAAHFTRHTPRDRLCSRPRPPEPHHPGCATIRPCRLDTAGTLPDGPGDEPLPEVRASYPSLVIATTPFFSSASSKCFALIIPDLPSTSFLFS